MEGFNNATLIGNFGKDPEMNTLEGGINVAKLTRVTNESYKGSHIYCLSLTSKLMQKREAKRVNVEKYNPMRVTERFPHPALDNHEIQIGISTWTQNNAVEEQTESIRRAVYNDEGKFSPHGSSEIPMEDMALLIRACIQRDRISRQEMTDILNDISSSLQRQSQ